MLAILLHDICSPHTSGSANPSPTSALSLVSRPKKLVPNIRDICGFFGSQKLLKPQMYLFHDHTRIGATGCGSRFYCGNHLSMKRFNTWAVGLMTLNIRLHLIAAVAVPNVQVPNKFRIC
jgi:hypothetical protein